MTKNIKETTDVSIIEPDKLPAELLKVAESSGIVVTEAQAIGMKFAPFMSKVNELSLKIAALEQENPTEEDAKLARRYRLDLVENRGTKGVDAVHKELKAESLVRGRLIDNYKNVVVGSSELSELIADKIEKFQERKQKEEQTALKQIRISLLEPFEVDTEFLPLDIMPEEKFAELLAKSKESFEAVKAVREKAEADRIEAERLAEEKRIADELAEQERIKAQQIENERLKKEAEAREKELAKERADAEKKAKEAEALRQEEQAKADAILKVEREAREKIEAELQAKKDQEEKERQQAIAEQQERDAAAKAALLAPDKEKINALFIAIRDFQFPECQTPEAIQIMTDVKDGFKIILQGIKDKSSTLK